MPTVPQFVVKLVEIRVELLRLGVPCTPFCHNLEHNDVTECTMTNHSHLERCAEGRPTNVEEEPFTAHDENTTYANTCRQLCYCI